MELETYLSGLQGKRVAVIGVGVSNRPLIDLLLSHGVQVTACDKKTDLGAYGDELRQRGCRLQLGSDYLRDLNQDLIFRTPGIRPDLPEFRGARLTSEMEVFFEVCPCPKIAVTGSDGKTTTTTIIAKLLEAAGKRVHLGGNIGHPLLSETPDIRPEDVAVLELSSFQLMTMRQSPEIAVVTNISPNHLDVHKDYAEYIAAKENIFTHQSAGDLAVFNADNDVTLAESGRAPGRVRLFSRRREVSDGVFLRGADIVSRRDGRERVVMSVSDIRLPGVHNVENYMAAVAAVDGIDYREADKVRAVEISFTDARTLGVTAPVRESGDVAGSAPCKIVGPCGEIEISEGVIVAKRHIHFTPEEAAAAGVEDKEIVSVKIDSADRSTIFGDVVVRVSPKFDAAMHIDTDEANAGAIAGTVYGEIIK